MKPWWFILLIVSGLILTGHAVGYAQSNALTDVYVTPQYTAVLRAGPGTHWGRLAVLPYGTTYRATGRTQNAQWVQIAFTGELLTDAYPEATRDGVTYGWVSTRLTFWTGNLFGLPIDGVRTVEFLRGSLVTLVILPAEPIYTGLIGPQQQVPYPLPEIGVARVEATGRYGSPPYLWVQFKIGADYYWVSRIDNGSYAVLPDVGQLVAGNRLALIAARNLNRVIEVQATLASLWSALANGQPISCQTLPGGYSLIAFSANDLAAEPIYEAFDAALTTASAALIRASERLQTACATPDQPISAAAINAALADLTAAQQALNLARLLLPLDADI